MGNSAGNALPFEIISSIEYERSDWKFHSGLRKEDKEKREEVAIFRFGKNADDNKLNWIPAQRSVQKLRTIKHPFILSYLDSVEMDDAILLVTESCLPLSAWVKTHMNNNNSSTTNITTDNVGHTQALSEVVWGLRCLLEALLFLNSTCNLTHGYIGFHAIFVCKTGDWKFGALELACNLNNADDRLYYKSKINLLSSEYMAPERRQFSQSSDADSIDDGLMSKQGAADIYALGIVMQNLLDQMNLNPSSTVTKCLKKMTSVDYRKRPTAKQALSYITDQMDLLSQLNELAIKPPAESLEILSKLSEHLNDIPVSACHHKVLPNVTKVLQMASNDFRNRDARESCRQAVQLSLTLLSSLSTSGKLEGGVFADTCLPVVLSLWTMSDRAIRTSLLKTLPVLIAHIPEASVNKNLFDPLLNGFADSNAKMREETLKNLVYVVDKLDERNLQDKLVRCIVGLQADAEAPIRTNAVIFIGRIAGRLKEGVRLRVLCTALLKALKDSFVHCRLAGLKAAFACLQYIDMPQLAGKILPMVCSLTLDRSTEVRESALNFIDAGTALLKQNHLLMKQQMEKDKAAGAQAARSVNNGTATGGGTGGSSCHHGEDSNVSNSGYGGLGSSWSSFSWSAVDGIAKTLEKTIVSATTDSNSSNNANNVVDVTSSRSILPSPAANLVTSTTVTSSSFVAPVVTANHSKTQHHPTAAISMALKSSVTTAGWDDDGDIDFVDDDDDEKKDNDDDYEYKPKAKSLSLTDSNSSSNNNSSNGLKLSNSSSNGWDDDPFDDDNDGDAFASKPTKLIVTTSIDKKLKDKTTTSLAAPSIKESSNSSYQNSAGITPVKSSSSSSSMASNSSDFFDSQTLTTPVSTMALPTSNHGSSVKTSSSSLSSSVINKTKKPVAAVKLAINENEKWDDF